MNVFTSSLSKLTFKDVVAFCDQKVKEAVNLDYKRDLSSGTLQNTVAALANTHGGVILIGVDADKDGVPVLPATGMPITKGMEDALWQKLGDSIYPPITPEVAVIEDQAAGKCFIVLRIRESEIAPHYILKANRVMATSFATTSYSARKRVGGISFAGSHFATGETPSRPRTAPRIGARSAKLASGTISYLQVDPIVQTPTGRRAQPYSYASSSPMDASDPTGLYTLHGSCPNFAAAVQLAKQALGPKTASNCYPDCTTNCRRRFCACPDLDSWLQPGTEPDIYFVNFSWTLRGQVNCSPMSAVNTAFPDQAIGINRSLCSNTFFRDDPETLASLLLHELSHWCDCKVGFNRQLIGPNYDPGDTTEQECF